MSEPLVLWKSKKTVNQRGGCKTIEIHEHKTGPTTVWLTDDNTSHDRGAYFTIEQFDIVCKRYQEWKEVKHV